MLPPTAIIADDDRAFSSRLAAHLKSLRYAVLAVGSADELVDCLTVHQAHNRFVILEPNLPGGIWLPLLRRTHRTIGAAKLVVTTAFPSIALAREARRLADAFFAKPVSAEVVLKTLLSPEPTQDGQWRSPRLSQMSLARVEWEYLNRTLRTHNGNVARTAQTLAIPRQTLYRKLRVYPPTR